MRVSRSDKSGTPAPEFCKRLKDIRVYQPGAQRRERRLLVNIDDARTALMRAEAVPTK
jgi:hypothetical protein